MDKKTENGKSESDTMDMSRSLNQLLENRVAHCTKDQPWIISNSEGSQLSKNTIDKIMPEPCKKANVKPFGLHFHSIRHHIAVQLAHQNWPLIKIQKFLRHKRATTTDIYLRSLIRMKTDGSSILDDLEQSMKATK